MVRINRYAMYAAPALHDLVWMHIRYSSHPLVWYVHKINGFLMKWGGSTKRYPVKHKITFVALKIKIGYESFRYVMRVSVCLYVCINEFGNLYIEACMYICNKETLLCLNRLRPRQNGRHVADDSFEWISLNENVWIPINISLKLVPNCLIDNMAALVQIMAWRHYLNQWWYN